MVPVVTVWAVEAIAHVRMGPGLDTLPFCPSSLIGSISDDTEGRCVPRGLMTVISVLETLNNACVQFSETDEGKANRICHIMRIRT
jgi:hypothetical protein